MTDGYSAVKVVEDLLGLEITTDDAISLEHILFSGLVERNEELALENKKLHDVIEKLMTCFIDCEVKKEDTYTGVNFSYIDWETFDEITRSVRNKQKETKCTT